MKRILTAVAIIALTSSVSVGNRPAAFAPASELIERSAVVVDATLVDVTFEREPLHARNDWSTNDLVYYSGTLKIHTVLAGGSLGAEQIPLEWVVDETERIKSPIAADFSSLNGDRAIWLLDFQDGALVPPATSCVWILEGVSWHGFWTAETALDALNERENPRQLDEVDLIRRYIAEFIEEQASAEKRPSGR